MTKILEVDVLTDLYGDGLIGLPELNTGGFDGSVMARVKGASVPGDGGGGTYLWNGTAWIKVLPDDYLSASVDQSFTSEQKAKLAENWPEAVSNAVVVNGAIRDGTSNPLSETYGTLAAAQADFPAATALTDETDWAAIQSALDDLNTVDGGEIGGVVFLPPGDYVINRTLYIRGPSVTLRGAGQFASYVEYTGSSGYALRLSPARGETVAQAGTNGLPRHVSIENLEFTNEDLGSTSAVGFSTLSPSDGQGFWYVLYLTIRQCNFHGFDVAVELANTPLAALYDCSITGRTCSLRMWKPDSVAAFNCDINGTFIRRGLTDSNQTQYDDSVNLEILIPETEGGDEIIWTTNPGFAFTMIGGELGHGGKVLRSNGGRAAIKGVNIEDISTDRMFDLSGATELHLENARIDASIKVPNGVGGFRAPTDLIYLACPSASTSYPQLWLRDLRVKGLGDTMVTRVEGNRRNAVVIDQDKAYPVAFYDETPSLVESIEKPGRIMASRQSRVLSSDSSAGNVALADEVAWIPRTGQSGEDLLTAYQHIDENYYRTSLLNDRLLHMLGQTTADTNSIAGTDQELETYTVPQLQLVANGDKLKIFIAGTFAANANNKGVVLQLYTATEFARYEDTAYNGLDFVLDITIQKRSPTLMLCTSTMSVDGIAPAVKVEQITANLNAARDLVLSSTGAGAADVVLKQFDLNYEKGISNL